MGDVIDETREENRVTASASHTRDTLLLTGVHHTPALGRDVALWRATRELVWPWSRRSYPGVLKAAGAALGFVPSTVKRWAFNHGPGISVTAARRIAALLRSHATRATALAADWETYAADRERTWTPPPYFRAARLAERDGWRSKKK